MIILDPSRCTKCGSIRTRCPDIDGEPDEAQLALLQNLWEVLTLLVRVGAGPAVTAALHAMSLAVTQDLGEHP